MKRKVKAYTEGLDARLGDPEFAAEYLTAAFAEGKSELLLALRDIARARGVAQVAKRAARGRESLYKALSKNGNPRLDTFLSVLDSVNVKLHFDPA